MQGLCCLGVAAIINDGLQRTPLLKGYPGCFHLNYLLWRLRASALSAKLLELLIAAVR